MLLSVNLVSVRSNSSALLGEIDNASIMSMNDATLQAMRNACDAEFLRRCGQTKEIMHPLNDVEQALIREGYKGYGQLNGNKVRAVVSLRHRIGCGLAHAKRSVEHWMNEHGY